MAALNCSAQVLNVAFTTTTKTIMQLLAPTNQRVRVKEISISFNGTSNTAAPIEVDAVRQTSAGTLTNTTTVRKQDNDLGETIQTAVKDTATAEPTDGGDVCWSDFVHPQTGLLWQAVPGYNEIIIKGAERLGIRVVTPGAGANCCLRVVFEE